MNTSYNYADFIGSNLNENDNHETLVENKASQKNKTTQHTKNNSPLNNELNQDKTVE